MNVSSDSRTIDLLIRIAILAVFLYLVLTLVAPLTMLMLWAGILCIAIFPLHTALSRWLGGHRVLSAIILTVLGIVLAVGPVAALALGIVEGGHNLIVRIEAGQIRLPPPDEAVKAWPVVGPRLYSFWADAHSNIAGLVQNYGPPALRAGQALLIRLAGFGVDLLTLLLSILVMGVLLVTGPDIMKVLRRFADRIYRGNGPALLETAGATVRNVSRGVIGVAAVQALLSGILMSAFGIAAAGPLALVILVLCIVQIGSGVVLIPLSIWAWTSMSPQQALVFTVFAVAITFVDNILRPLMMSQGLKTPFLAILVGLIGGVIAYGVVGIFVGPVIIAVFIDLFTVWIGTAEDEPDTRPAAPDRTGKPG
ncbi:AI-2E family transporter [Tropicimonas sp.]|uniref:AI-2E family transporter n=1 Tax=Tropicimonas sp. TaxID=2067044 RepID=UPI003A8A54CF